MPGEWRFGEFEFRPATGELRFRGRRAELQPQPARVLALLVERRGELVSRDELRRLLWGEDVYVEYDQSINFCICQLRRALQDDAAKPRWIETLPRLGYRFAGAASAVAALPAAVASGAPESPAIARAAFGPSLGRPRTARAAAIVAILGLAALAASLPLARRPLATESPAGASPVVRQPPLGQPSALRPALGTAALAAYGRGLYLARRDGIENVDRGIAELRLAVELAPEAAAPRAELAQALLARHRQKPSLPALREAEAAARSAVALAPDLAEAHRARADVALMSHYDWDTAEAEYRTALRLDPGLARGWSGYAALLAARGRLDDAIGAAQRARELDPVCLAASADLGWYLYLARRYDASIRASRETLALAPGHTLAHLTIIYALLEQHDDRAALGQANAHLLALFDGGDLPAPRARSLAEYWQGSVEYLRAAARRSYLPPSDLALPQLQLGQEEDGLRLLLRSCEEHAGRDLLFAAVDPRLDAWRRDPRLREVLDCLGLDGTRAI